MTDKELIEGIQSDDPKKRDWFLYSFISDGSFWEWTKSYVTSHGGSINDAEDVFVESLVIFDRNIRQGKFDGKSLLKTYLMAIIKWHYVSYRSKNKKIADLEFVTERFDVPDINLTISEINKDRVELLTLLMQSLTEDCREILKMYILGDKMKDIQEKFKFSDENQARKKVFMCKQRLRMILEKHPEILKQLKELS